MQGLRTDKPRPKWGKMNYLNDIENKCMAKTIKKLCVISVAFLLRMKYSGKAAFAKLSKLCLFRACSPKI